jgi:diguanylate cyclase (GGDEF)-like protein
MLSGTQGHLVARMRTAGIDRTPSASLSTPSGPDDPNAPGDRRRTRWGVPRPLLSHDEAVQLLIAGLLLAFLTSTILAPRRGGLSTLWDGVVYTSASLLPFIPIARRIRRSSAQRSAWLALALAVLLNWSAVVLVVLRMQFALAPELPRWAGAAHSVAAFALLAGVGLLTQSSLRRVPASQRLDGLVGGLAAASVIAMMAFRTMLGSPGGVFVTISRVVNPACDLLLCALVVAGVVSSRHRPNWPTILVMAGAGAWVGGDVALWHLGGASGVIGGTPLAASWLAGLWAVSLGASVADRRQERDRRRSGRTAPWVALVPVVGGAVALSVVAATLREDRWPPIVSFLGLAALAVTVVRMWSSLREENHLVATASRDARTDPLTGLPNRRSIFEQIESQLHATPPVATGVILIDLDGFKEVNDSLGHLAGDELLDIIGERFASAVGAQGVFGRLGGDEFAMVASSASSERLIELARDLRATLAEPCALDGISVHVGASMGIAVAASAESTSVELLRSADVAMYEAKRTRSGIEVYRASADANSREQLELLADLRRAIDSRELRLHYQPTLDMPSGRITGVEALARWPHATLGTVYPETFIPMTERAGLMPQLTRAVLAKAITETASLHRAGHRLRLSVNISRYDLLDSELPGYISDLLRFHAFPANYLTIEITETSLGTDPDRAAKCIQQLRSRGVRVSIDDYGVGYSSMSQLLELVIDEIKIDKSFVTGLCSDSRAEAIVRSAVGVARALGVSLVTEGIETEDVLQALRHIGADIGQGYFISKPLPYDELCAFLESPALSVEVTPGFSLIPSLT